MANNNSNRSLINLVAFVALIFIGIALIISRIGFSGDFPAALQTIASVLAYVTVAFCAFIYAYSQRGNARLWCLIAWAIAVVLILLFYVFAIV